MCTVDCAGYSTEPQKRVSSPKYLYLKICKKQKLKYVQFEDNFLVFFQSVEIGVVVWNGFGAEAVFGSGGGGGGKGEYKMQKTNKIFCRPKSSFT